LGRQHLKWARVQGWPPLTAGRAALCSITKAPSVCGHLAGAGSGMDQVEWETHLAAQ